MVVKIPRRTKDSDSYLADHLTRLWSVIHALEGNLFKPAAALGVLMKAKLTLIDPSNKPPIKSTAALGLQMAAKLQAALPPVKTLPKSTASLGIGMVVKLTKSTH